MICLDKTYLRLKTLVFLAALNFIFYVNNAQTSIKKTEIEFETNHASLQLLITEIESQSDYKFVYSSKKIPVNSKIQIPENTLSINEFLTILNNQYEISNYISGKQIVLFKEKISDIIRISGYVEDAKTGERLIACNIYNSNLIGTISNNFGYYTIAQSTENILNFSYVGYKPFTMDVNSAKDTFINVKLEPFLLLDEVEIIGREKSLIDETNPLNTYLPHKLIDNIPSVFGEGDLMKAIQLTPGTQSGLENTNGISVRGGGPGENIMLFDGIKLYHYNHLLGMLSIFDNNIIKHSKIIKGGMPAYYGGRLSSCVDVRLKEGNMQEMKSEIALGFPALRAHIEGPIIKNKLSFLISGRSTLTIIPLLLLNNSDNSTRNLYKYNDLTLKLNYKFSNKSRIYYSFYNGTDNFRKYQEWSDLLQNIEYINNNNLKWGNRLMVLRWNYLISKNVFLNTSISNSTSFFKHEIEESYYTEFNKEDIEFEDDILKSGINDWTANFMIDHQVSSIHYLKYGINSSYYYLEPNVNGFIYSDFENFYTTEAASNDQTVKALENALFINDNFLLGSNLQINMGIRLSSFTADNNSYIKIEPRLSSSCKISENLCLLGSLTRNYQYIHLLNYTNLILPTDLWVNSNANIQPSFADQITLGLNKKIHKNFSLMVEGYYKKQQNLLTFTEGPKFLSMHLSWQEKVEIGKGKNYGMELLLHKMNGKLTGWVSYTISHAERKFENINNDNPFVFKYEKPHILNLVVNYKIKKNIEAGATWIYTSGLPYTSTGTSYQSAIDDFSYEIFRDVKYQAEIDNIHEKNNDRMIAYHRLDVSLKVIKQIRNTSLELKSGIYNAYNRHNPIYMYAVNEEMHKISVFPILPFLQIKMKFNLSVLKNR